MLSPAKFQQPFGLESFLPPVYEGEGVALLSLEMKRIVRQTGEDVFEEYVTGMQFGPRWVRHVGKVSATLELVCLDAREEEITSRLGIPPTSAKPGRSEKTNERPACRWRYDTSVELSSTDINEHLWRLLELFLPLKERIDALPQPNIRTVEILWESIIAGAATPELKVRCLQGLAELGANLRINMVKIESIEEN